MEIQLAIANNFCSFIENDLERVMYSKRDTIEIIIIDESHQAIKKHFDSLKNRYQKNFESMVLRFSLIMFRFCVINVIKQISIVADHISILLIV